MDGIGYQHRVCDARRRSCKENIDCASQPNAILLDDPQLTLVGGPAVLIEYYGLRILTDPTFDAPGDYDGRGVALTKLSRPALPPGALAPVDAILLSHDQHADNLDRAGREFLGRAERVITTLAGAERLNAEGLKPWQTVDLTAPDGGRLRVTATPARPLSHDHGRQRCGGRGPCVRRRNDRSGSQRWRGPSHGNRNGCDADLRRAGAGRPHRGPHPGNATRALDDIVRSGKARYLGASSMHAWQFCHALHLAGENGWTRFISMQDHYNLMNREEEREMIPLCTHEGIGLIPWSPLARGRLARRWGAPSSSGRVRVDETARQIYSATETADARVVANLESVAAARNLPLAQVALAWLFHKPVVAAPIIGATRLEHLDDAVRALEVALDPDEIKALEASYVPHGVVGYA
jgi:diketogulonate reductase-like aldo/keto reductase